MKGNICRCACAAPFHQARLLLPKTLVAPHVKLFHFACERLEILGKWEFLAIFQGIDKINYLYKIECKQHKKAALHRAPRQKEKRAAAKLAQTLLDNPTSKLGAIRGSGFHEGSGKMVLHRISRNVEPA